MRADVRMCGCRTWVVNDSCCQAQTALRTGCKGRTLYTPSDTRKVMASVMRQKAYILRAEKGQRAVLRVAGGVKSRTAAREGGAESMRLQSVHPQGHGDHRVRANPHYA